MLGGVVDVDCGSIDQRDYVALVVQRVGRELDDIARQRMTRIERRKERAEPRAQRAVKAVAVLIVALCRLSSIN